MEIFPLFLWTSLSFYSCAYIIMVNPMNEKNFRIAVYTVLFILVLIFFTKDFNLFSDFYKNIKQVKNPGQIDVLVNKNYKLSHTYMPSDLEPVNITYAHENKYLRHDAKVAYEKMAEQAKKEGYQIILVSAYRSYSYQKELYQHYIKTSGKNYADRCSARPGHSEHQTGLALDIMGENNDYNLFEQTKEFTWIQQNAHKYGFILRYPNNKTDITGFKYEPWHYRYVGRKLALELKNKSITLEEYYFKKYGK